METAIIKTPWGFMASVWSTWGLRVLTLPYPEPAGALAAVFDHAAPTPVRAAGRDSRAAGLEQALARYFAGEAEGFDLPVDWSVYTPFQRRVLQVVQRIPRGRTLSYGEVATLAECPGGARAAGGALGANRTLLVVPCHRVVRSDGTLGGFTGGLCWKDALLRLEGLDPSAGILSCEKLALL